MKKTKVIAFLQGLVLTFPIETVVTAYDTTNQSQYKTSINDYIQDILPFYINSEFDGTLPSVYVSNQYNLYDFNDLSKGNEVVYFVFDQNEIIGLFTVSEYKGNFYSSFEKKTKDNTANYFNQLQANYENSINIMIGNDNGAFMIREESLPNARQKNTTVLSAIEKSQEILISPLSDSSLYYKQLNTTAVANSTSDSGAGLCWAATIAVRFNYRNLSNTTRLTSYYVYKKLQGSYKAEPTGTSLWVLRGYSTFSHNIPSTSAYSEMLTYSEITTQLKNDNPIHMHLTNNTDKAHAVLLSGIKIYNGHCIYYIDDPNKTSHIAVYVSSDTMQAKSDFIYAASSTTVYSSWYYSFY